MATDISEPQHVLAVIETDEMPAERWPELRDALMEAAARHGVGLGAHLDLPADGSEDSPAILRARMAGLRIELAAANEQIAELEARAQKLASDVEFAAAEAMLMARMADLEAGRRRAAEGTPFRLRTLAGQLDTVAATLRHSTAPHAADEAALTRVREIIAAGDHGGYSPTVIIGLIASAIRPARPDDPDKIRARIAELVARNEAGPPDADEQPAMIARRAREIAEDVSGTRHYPEPAP